jgi:hypothetical protein
MLFSHSLSRKQIVPLREVGHAQLETQLEIQLETGRALRRNGTSRHQSFPAG